MLTVLLDKPRNPIDLDAAETSCPFENDRIEPKLRYLLFAFYVDVRWFAPINDTKKNRYASTRRAVGILEPFYRTVRNKARFVTLP